MQDLSNYQNLKESAQDFYNNINSVFSPALKEKITFPAEGFNHIIFKTARTERERSSQILRFKLLPLAKKLIEISTTYQEFEETIGSFTVKKHKKKIKLMLKKYLTIVVFYGIIKVRSKDRTAWFTGCKRPLGELK